MSNHLWDACLSAPLPVIPLPEETRGKYRAYWVSARRPRGTTATRAMMTKRNASDVANAVSPRANQSSCMETALVWTESREAVAHAPDVSMNTSTAPRRMAGSTNGKSTT